ncbi:MAG: hypothetical protein RBG13Loki_3651 [Promethearchaeota archaeon CR_4]|nr:MAG: hypothetical protein RBG13Loki_3651 [Candidatus Lokiarchaeota archaeon CR_4]
MPWCTYCGRFVTAEQAQRNNFYCHRCAKRGIPKPRGRFYVGIFMLLVWGFIGLLILSVGIYNIYSPFFGLTILITYGVIVCAICYDPIVQRMNSSKERDSQRGVG